MSDRPPHGRAAQHAALLPRERGAGRARDSSRSATRPIHTNPLYGRGCTFALVHAALLADRLDKPRRRSPRALRIGLEADVEREMVPVVRDDAHAGSRGRVKVAETLRLRAGTQAGPPHRLAVASSIRSAYHARPACGSGLVPALRLDATVLRAFLRSVQPAGWAGRSTDAEPRGACATHALDVYQTPRRAHRSPSWDRTARRMIEHPRIRRLTPAPSTRDAADACVGSAPDVPLLAHPTRRSPQLGLDLPQTGRVPNAGPDAPCWALYRGRATRAHPPPCREVPMSKPSEDRRTASGRGSAC